MSDCRASLQVPEHTWGPDVKVYLNDYDNWSNELFEAVRGSENYNVMEAAWTRQRSYTRWALEALKDGSSAVRSDRPAWNHQRGQKPVSGPAKRPASNLHQMPCQIE